MLKKLFIIPLCLFIGIFISTLSFSQDDPSATEEGKAENVQKENKVELQEEAKKEEMKSAEVKKEGQPAPPPPMAKTYTDGRSIYVNSQVMFKLTATDDIGIEKIEYKIDNGAPMTYANSFSLPQEGFHTIRYYGIDKFGNQEPDKSYSIFVDNTGPVIVVTAGTALKKVGDKLYNTKGMLYSINVNDALSGVNKVEYTTNGIDFKEYVAPFALPTTGEITLKVKAIDNVNNPTDQFAFRGVDESGNEFEIKEATVKLYTDETGPVVEIKPDKEIKQIDSKNVAASDVKYTVMATDAGSGVATIFYRLDGKGDFIPYKGEIQFLTNGKHQIDARAIDKVGNMSDIVSLPLYVDILPPHSSIEAEK